MQVSYTLGGTPYSVEIEADDDLKGIIEEAERTIRSQHAELEAHAELLVVVTSGILDSLADGNEDAFLGELNAVS